MDHAGDDQAHPATGEAQGRRSLRLPSMRARRRARHDAGLTDHCDRKLVDDLRRATAKGELTVVYQPTVDMATLTPVGAEALVRWPHPARGLLVPADFIGVAERSGLIGSITTHVLGAACEEAMHWSSFIGGQSVVAVNLSPRDIIEPTIIRSVTRALELSGLRPDRLCLELTESAAIADHRGAADTLQALSDLGTHIAVDDFGTGFASLAHLMRFPIDIVKIDRMFIADLGASQPAERIVSAVIELAHALGLTAVAEGVETTVQRDILVGLGCDMFQGHLYSPALAPWAVASLLDNVA